MSCGQARLGTRPHPGRLVPSGLGLCHNSLTTHVPLEAAFTHNDARIFKRQIRNLAKPFGSRARGIWEYPHGGERHRFRHSGQASSGRKTHLLVHRCACRLIPQSRQGMRGNVAARALWACQSTCTLVSTYTLAWAVFVLFISQCEKLSEFLFFGYDNESIK